MVISLPARFTIRGWAPRALRIGPLDGNRLGPTQSLRGQDLAKYLHAFYSTHRYPFPVAVETLHAWSGSPNPQIADFKRQLQQALNRLKEIGLMLDGNIEKSMVVLV